MKMDVRRAQLSGLCQFSPRLFLFLTSIILLLVEVQAALAGASDPDGSPTNAAPGALDLSFDTGSGPNGGVRTVDLQAAGKIAIGGDFSAVNGTSRNQLARLHSDGQVDPSFDPPVPIVGAVGHNVGAVVCQSDGRVLAAGGYDDSSIRQCYVVRYTASGQLETSFPGAMPSDVPPMTSFSVIALVRTIKEEACF
jgi:hypothetical protein